MPMPVYGQTLTPAPDSRRQELAQYLMGQGLAPRITATGGAGVVQGLAGLAQAFAGKRLMEKDREESENRRNEAFQRIAELTQGGEGGEGAINPRYLELARTIENYQPGSGIQFLTTELTRAPADTRRLLSPEEEAAMGLDPSGQYQTDRSGQIYTIRDPETPPWTGAVKGPDGQWIADPNYIDAQSRIRAAGKTTVTNNIELPKPVLKADEKTLELGAEAAAQARDVIPLFGIAREAAKRFEGSGVGGKVVLGYERIKRALGMPSDAPAGEVLQAMQTRLGALQRVPGSGATSDMEFAAYMSAVPSLMNTQEGNIALADIGEKLARRRLENYEAMRNYYEANGTTTGYMPNDEPALTDEEYNTLMGAAFGPRSGGPEMLAPQPGDVVDGYRFNGGDPADEKNWEVVP